MKWKSVSPDTKRRESPKFKSGGGAGGHGHYYRSFDLTLIMMRITNIVQSIRNISSLINMIALARLK